MSEDDNQIDWRKVSPATIERMRVIAAQRFQKPMGEVDVEEIPEAAMRQLRAEAERRGTTIYEVIEWLVSRSVA